MAKLIKPSGVKVVPKDGELEITININISLDALASSDGSIALQPLAITAPKKEDDKVDLLVPDFPSAKVDFGK